MHLPRISLTIALTSTFALLCGTSSASAAAQSPAATFTKDVAPILFANCAACHRSGEVAPFSLLTYNDAKRRASQLADVTESKFMPPWLPHEGHGNFQGSRRLTEAQIK